ncbi:Dyslexia susceptibility 1 candidate gene 1 protein like protein [Dufourea novaeangliae]|uniref:Dyslexia susceptibility 1 candidate gene 1 protein like protein n=1 Tax=Dufourea novaeangliae TaxID=178035 RepID=A0A154P6C6_DUFNO|nr:Dyslexia susceptibility 1 candidate gene 1 protein like protein [Dufourea novaeangliae]
MPAIFIKDYTWRQTSEFVILNVPLRGNPKRVDIFVIGNYLKVSFPPFILELFLWTDVVENGSKCSVADREAILSLQKLEISQEWPSLEVQNIDNDIKREYRNRALERAQANAEELAKTKKEKRLYLQREAVKEQININTVTLNKIDEIRNAHRKEAMLEFEDWRSKAELPFLSEVQGVVQENRQAYKAPLKWFRDGNNELTSRSKTDNEILCSSTLKKGFEDRALEIEEPLNNSDKDDGDKKIIELQMKDKSIEQITTDNEKSFCDTTDDSSCSAESDSEHQFIVHGLVKEMSEKKLRKFYEKKKKSRPGLESVIAAINGKLLKKDNIFEAPSKSIPLPRKKGTINVTFSDRKFPTPARESSHFEEEEWLEKQAEARRKIGFDSTDLRPEERDPQWLKDKGDEFFKDGNYLAAISAYTYGIKISDKLASLYVNRSAAQYALKNYYRCLEDCSKALELMEPKCESNRESRARCHARRGAALCKLSSPQHGIPELEAALKLTPDNESIKRDVLAARQYFDIKD